MRCPQCTERNSVAARKCEFCGEGFKKKPVGVSLKLAVAGVAVALTASIAASYVVPTFTDPSQNLERVAKRLAAGPKSPEDATKIKKEFTDAVRAFLKNNGEQKTEKLTEGLQKLLPLNAFEVHIAELPRGMRVIEIDTVLQATDYLVMKTSSGSKVFDLPGVDVFDDARIINDSAGPVLTLIGHTSGPPPHKPQVRTFALLPDQINDESTKLVPTLIGDGDAQFDRNGQDVLVELLMPAQSKPNRVASREDYTYGTLRWKNARYNADFTAPSAKVASNSFRSQHLAYVPPARTTPASKPIVNTVVASKAPQTAATGPAAPAKIVVRGLTDKPGVVLATAPPIAHGAAMAATPPIAPTIPALQERIVPKVAPSANTVTENKPEPKPPAKQRVGQITVTGATLRTSARRGSAPMANLGKGALVTVLSDQGDWYHVRYQGSEGYIYNSLLSTSGSAPVEVAAAPRQSRSSRRSSTRNTERTLIAQLPPAAATPKKKRRRAHVAEVETPILVP